MPVLARDGSAHRAEAKGQTRQNFHGFRLLGGVEHRQQFIAGRLYRAEPLLRLLAAYGAMSWHRQHSDLGEANRYREQLRAIAPHCRVFFEEAPAAA